MAWMIIRVRGTLHARHDVIETFHSLHLTRPNHATVVPENPSYRGMITRIQGYATWGEADEETVQLLLRTRGALRPAPTDRPSPAGVAAEPPADLGSLARTTLEKGLDRTPGIKPLLRLGAPKGGWRSTKKPFARGGALGYRGPKINELARRMM